MIVFNEEEEESKSRYEGDYNQPNSAGLYGMHIAD